MSCFFHDERRCLSFFLAVDLQKSPKKKSFPYVFFVSFLFYSFFFVFFISFTSMFWIWIVLSPFDELIHCKNLSSIIHIYIKTNCNSCHTEIKKVGYHFVER